MTGYVLDTNVISELSKRTPHERVLAWMGTMPDVYLSVLTVGELLRGIPRLHAKDRTRAEHLSQWIQGVRSKFATKIIPVDSQAIERWAQMSTQRTLPVIDSLIAATALAHDLTIATRNVKDFQDTGVRVFNPFNAS